MQWAQPSALRRTAPHLRWLQAALGEALDARCRCEEAYEGSQAALESLRKKLEVYKRWVPGGALAWG